LSSILRALKKLENEPRHLDETQPLDSKFVPLADTSPQKSYARTVFMVIGGGFVCGFVVLAGWWLFSEKQQAPAVAPQKVSGQKLQPPDIAPATPKDLKVAERYSTTDETTKPIADKAVSMKTTDQVPELIHSITPQPSYSKIEPREALPPNQQAAVSTIQVPETTSPEVADHPPAEKVEVPVTRAPVVQTKIKEAEIPVLNDPEMKLQAITWSKNPQKRIVVINNRILRQGEVAHGYRVDTINQDDVVLSDAGEKWKLLFHIK
jgi:hypothetical protein